MSDKIRIKVGTIELEYESEKALAKADALELLASVSATAKARPGGAATLDGAGDDADVEHSVSDIAQKIDAKTGPDLLKAAAASLTLVKNKPKFTRKELTTEMKLAGAYWKSSYTKNLGAYLKTLVRGGEFLQQGEKEYALSATAKSDIRAKLS